MLISSNMDFHKHSEDRFTYGAVVEPRDGDASDSNGEKKRKRKRCRNATI